MQTKSENYCQAMTLFFGTNGKPLANLVMSLSSYTSAKSLVEYSESPLYHYQYSSIGKLFERLLKSVGKDTSKFAKQVHDFIGFYVPQQSLVSIQLDSFPVYKPLSSCHPDRMAVYRPNVKVEGQSPVEIGYNISSLNQGFAQKWSIPHSMERVSTSQTYQQVGREQLQAYLDGLPCSEVLVVNTADSSYGTAEFLAPLYHNEQLVNICRLKNRNVYDYAPQNHTGGANRIYGQVYNLRKMDEISSRKNPKTGQLADLKPSIETKIPDQTIQYQTLTNKNRPINVVLKKYQNMMIRSKNGFNMKDKSFDLVIVEMYDAQTQQAIHQKPIYLAVVGKKNSLLALQDVYQQHYSHRYDIEPNNRFVKHQLGLDGFQTPIQKHFDLWLSIIQLTQWLLFLAAKEVANTPKKWQQYDPKNQQNQVDRLSITQTRKSCQPFF
jgi:hypothetical protein